MGSHRGGHADTSRSPVRRRVVLLVLGMAAALAAWGALVWAAIDLGREARSGATEAWWVMGVATLGAVLCLFVMLLLGARLLSVVQRRDEPARPPRVAGGHRAAR